MASTGSLRSAVARHVGGPQPARPHRSTRVIGQTLSRAYSAQIQNPTSAETLPEPGPSTLIKNVKPNRSTTKTHSETSKQPTILLYPSPVVKRSRPNRLLSPPQPLRIPYPQPQTRFEEGFNKRLRVWGLDDATKYLIKVLQAKHASLQPNQPLKPLGVTQEFLDKVLCALRLSAPVAYANVGLSKWLRVPVPMPQYGWLDSTGVERPAPAKALTQAMTLLQIVRDSGRPRPQEHYAALIKAFLARGHIEEATKLYVELVLDWNVQSASGGKAVSRFATDASDETRRAVEMISAGGDHLGLRRDMPAEVRKETVERGVMPFPQAGMLNAICKHLEAQIQAHTTSRRNKTPTDTAEATNTSDATSRPLGIRPIQHTELFRALESVRVLSTLLYHNQLPYGTTYRSYEPLLKVLGLVPSSPKYTVEVVLPKSEDKDPDASPKWMRIGKFGNGLAEGDKAPHVFRTSLHLFARTLVNAITGRGEVKKAAVPAAEQKPSTPEPVSTESP
ncbi:hypothetical protein M407DRAFT_21354 [Tulasnella calospora MUT 4182]|uniref:Uncharacterized protein n=1 Tax=Tulasnella calospora MUT 4182 TaxID=1051891 RepID=A0A0C3QN77_9AGAM|nr:hypothetical protein M407DRAFT_21354 [Tulasnella calospora MUT 4182]